MSRPVLLMILDGVGIAPAGPSNAVTLASTPVLDELMTSSLYRTIYAHGPYVGMPTDQDMGNSEVGHNALGAGRVFDQGASLVKDAIDSGALFEGDTWNGAISQVLDSESTLHFIGLLSDGNVHSHISHVLKMCSQAASRGIRRLRLHCLLDGRDVDQCSSKRYVTQLETHLAQINQEFQADFRIASGGGRMVTTMDRYQADWSIVKRGWDAHVLGVGRAFKSTTEAIETMYKEVDAPNDQYLDPFVIHDDQGPVGTIQDQDSVICFNFRGDRAIELTQAFEMEDFEHFDRVRHPDVFYAGIMQYDGDLQLPRQFLVPPPAINSPISEYLCEHKIRSFAISETQKYGHVTYFWNGNRSGYIDSELEEFVEIKSHLTPADENPEMKAYEITDKTIELLKSGNFDFGRLNFPNGDMVGHTGNLEATVQCIEVVDECVGKLLEVMKTLGGVTIILADHGNADEMFTIKDGVQSPKTSHTLNPVPFVIVDSQYDDTYVLSDLPKAGLSNVASTICDLLGLEAPEAYDPSLIRFR